MVLINEVQLWATEWPVDWRVGGGGCVVLRLLHVNSGLFLMPLLCFFERALRIKTKSGVPVAGLDLISKEECWPLCAIFFLETVVGVAPYYSRTRQTEALQLWNRCTQIHDSMKSQLKAHWLERPGGPTGTPCHLGFRYSSGCLVRGRTLHCHRIQILIRRVLQRQCHIRYVLSVWLASGISLVTNGLIGSVCFRVLLWGKVIAFMSVIHAFKKQGCESSVVRKGHLDWLKRFIFPHHKWNPAICLGKQWDCRRDLWRSSSLLSMQWATYQAALVTVSITPRCSEPCPSFQ